VKLHRFTRAPLALAVFASVLVTSHAHVQADTLEGIDVVTVREDGVLSGRVVRALAQAARPNEMGIAVINSLVLQMTGVRRAGPDDNPNDLITPPGEYERYGAIVPVGMETWPETYGRVVDIEDTLKANEAVVATDAAARWNVRVGDALVIVGWRGETVEVEIGQIIDGARLQNSEIVVWDKLAKTKGWVYPYSVFLWGERDLI
jgi:hypothetical protein